MRTEARRRRTTVAARSASRADPADDAPRRIDLELAAAEPSLEPGREVDDRRQRLVDLVGELRRHALERVQPQHVRQLRLLLIDAGLGPAALGRLRVQNLHCGGELLRPLVDAPLQLFVGALQGLLGPHTFRDVDGEDDDADDLPSPLR